MRRLEAPRRDVPGLANISGANATVTVVAWLKLLHPLSGGAYVGGVWEVGRSVDLINWWVAVGGWWSGAGRG
jgi:hypothetical protein